MRFPGHFEDYPRYYTCDITPLASQRNWVALVEELGNLPSSLGYDDWDLSSIRPDVDLSADSDPQAPIFITVAILEEYQHQCRADAGRVEGILRKHLLRPLPVRYFWGGDVPYGCWD